MVGRFVLLLAVAGCLAATGLIVIGSSRSSTAIEGRSTKKLVFDSDSRMYVANGDGSGLQPVGPRDGGDPVWSPDGTRIAFARGSDLRCCSVWIMNASGRGLRRVGEGYTPVWSSDGATLGLECDVGACVVGADGTPRFAVGLDNVSFPYYAAWSPDLSRVAYVDADLDVIYLIEVPSGSRTAVPTAPVKNPWRPAWSPDGSQIAFLSRNDDFLYVMDARSGSVRKLTSAQYNVTPAWSPDGRSILYTNDGDLYLIGADGTGKLRLTSTRDADAPAWSPDGQLIAYQRGRVSGDGAVEAGNDIWVIRPNGAGAAPVTRAFPDGVDYLSPRVARGRVPATTAPRLALISLAPRRTLIAPQMMLAIAADGPRVAFNAEANFNSCLIGVWNAQTAAVRMVGHSCGDSSGIDSFALAGTRIAWTFTEDTLSLNYSELRTTRLGSGRQDGISADNDQNDYLGLVAGHGSLLVFNRWKYGPHGTFLRPQLWRIVGARTAKTQLIHAGRDAIQVVAVGTGHVGVYSADGTFVVLRPDGRKVATLRVGRGVHDIVLSGSELALRRGRTIEVYDIGLGKRVRMRTLRSDPSTLTLAGLRQNIVVYVAGVAIHVLRLTDGRDVILRLRNEAGPADARLEPEGLYYSYNEAFSPKPGRIGFVPLRQLLARLG